MKKIRLYTREYLISTMLQDRIRGANRVTLLDWQAKGVVKLPQTVQVISDKGEVKKYLYTKEEIQQNLRNIKDHIKKTRRKYDE